MCLFALRIFLRPLLHHLLALSLTTKQQWAESVKLVLNKNNMTCIKWNGTSLCMDGFSGTENYGLEASW